MRNPIAAACLGASPPTPPPLINPHIVYVCCIIILNSINNKCVGGKKLILWLIYGSLRPQKEPKDY